MPTSDKELIERIKARISRPMLIRELMRQLRIKPERKRELKRILDDLVMRGEIVRTRGNRFGLSEKMDLETGRFQAHPAGYGFVIPEKKGRPDIYIAARSRLDAMDGDTVVVRVSPPSERKKAPGKREGVIVRILARAHTKVVGSFELSPSQAGVYGFVTPSNPRIAHDVIIGQKNAGGASDGDLVSAELISYPMLGRPPEGRIIRIIGKPGQPGIEAEIVIEEHELPVEFHPAALKEAEAVPQEVMPSMSRGRRDLRDLPTATIDGETAKDFDDALSIEKIPTGYRLWVHIADVANYVKEGSYLDQEAYRRGTSVYLPDRAIPMLPTSLSNGICSLNPGVDRLTLTAEMDFTSQGVLSRYDLYESVIRSNERMTYTAVKEILVDRDRAQRRRYAALAPQFELMGELMEILRKRRMKRGSIDFDLPEPQIVLDLQGKISDITRAERNRAHMIVEEFMLAANETVAAHMEEREIPCVYRVHDEPKEDAVLALQEFLSSVGITLAAGKKLKPLHLQRAVEQAKGTPLEAAVNTVILRAMKQARYATENSGHFGLAAETYTHFTSPIRR
ncbi:MAG: ribonuclease R, partial [Nitrospirae bacterium GWD2_57_8]